MSEKKKKKLSPAKQKIIENYERQKQVYLDAGYEECEETISILKANIMAFATAGPFIIAASIIWLLVKTKGEGTFGIFEFVLFYLIFIALVFVHELLHGLGWVAHTKEKWKSIFIGIMRESFTPYCHCKEPLKPKHYLIGVLAPFMVLGIGIFIAALATGNMMLFLLSLVDMLTAGGDTTIAWMLRKYLNKKEECLILDHPTDCGFVAFVKRK